jgi:hypothetical protein
MNANEKEFGLETPIVDHLEQLTPFTDDGDDEPLETTVMLAEISEADEADVLEQAISVPTDEDYRTE